MHLLSTTTTRNSIQKTFLHGKHKLVDCCLGLATVDEETMTVRFVHYSLEEYFRTHGNEYFPDGPSDAGRVCLTYLNFGKVNQHCTTMDGLREKVSSFPFLEYASYYWGKYVMQQYRRDLETLAMKLLQFKSGSPGCPVQVLLGSFLEEYG